MNARSCQLCGKPISRLRVGGDGDFCSREHRNQHRLSRGMDRLEEANKVTSLMRRRENPRHISAARLMCNNALDQRGSREPKPLAPENEIAAYSPMLPGPAAPRVNRGPDRYKPARATRLPGLGVSRRADPSRLSIGDRGTLPTVPPRRQKPQAKISQAPLVSLRCDTPAPTAVRRDYGMLRRGRIRVHLGNGSLAPGALEPRRGGGVFVPVLDSRCSISNCAVLPSNGFCRNDLTRNFHFGLADPIQYKPNRHLLILRAFTPTPPSGARFNGLGPGRRSRPNRGSGRAVCEGQIPL